MFSISELHKKFYGWFLVPNTVIIEKKNERGNECIKKQVQNSL